MIWQDAGAIVIVVAAVAFLARRLGLFGRPKASPKRCHSAASGPPDVRVRDLVRKRPRR